MRPKEGISGIDGESTQRGSQLEDHDSRSFFAFLMKGLDAAIRKTQA